ncbi:MAG: hypothetical protein QOI08_4435 [Actinomycetota bacterium]|nr:hypothetical protein [Actinomycetota bacterium]
MAARARTRYETISDALPALSRRNGDYEIRRATVVAASPPSLPFHTMRGPSVPTTRPGGRDALRPGQTVRTRKPDNATFTHATS